MKRGCGADGGGEDGRWRCREEVGEGEGGVSVYFHATTHRFAGNCAGLMHTHIAPGETCCRKRQGVTRTGDFIVSAVYGHNVDSLRWLLEDECVKSSNTEGIVV